jgi:hypothetical protein
MKDGECTSRGLHRHNLQLIDGGQYLVKVEGQSKILIPS